MRHRGPPRPCVAALAAAIAIASGCSGDPPATIAAPDAGIEGWTLDNFCPLFAKKWCEAVSDCCDHYLYSFAAEGCEARYIEESCEPMVQLVRDGKLTFQLELFSREGAEKEVEECLDTWRQRFGPEKCGEPSFYDSFDLVFQHNVKCNMFGGEKQLGDECETPAECRKTLKPNGEWTYCLNEHGQQILGPGTCSLGYMRKAGEGCGGGDVCDRGLYCFKSAPGAFGYCAHVTASGKSCIPDPASDQCGWEAYCDPSSTPGKCKKALAGAGAPCAGSIGVGSGTLTYAHECRSQICAFGRCTHPVFWYEQPYLTEVYLGDEVCNGGTP